jgi:peroxiredoxin Q/BCP
MATPKVGNKAPVFKGICTGEENVDLSKLKGKKVILYFYPKDSTPGCTTEGQNFRDLYKQFKKEGTLIFGLSRESLKSHENFKTMQSFPFELISDPDEKICNQYEVIKEKSMYGRKYMGIERSTFLIDEKGKLVQEWRKVKVTDHAQEVLDTVKAMK